MKDILIKILLSTLILMTSTFAGQKLDQAARIAAKDLLRKTINKQHNIKRIAFLPLKGDKYQLTDVFIATLSELNSDIDFIARDQASQDAAATETDFTEANDDIMDSKTLTTLEDLKIKGVEAVFIGTVRSAHENTTSASLSVKISLIDVKTHKILNSALLTVTYPQFEERQNYQFDPLVEKAAQHAAYNVFKLLENNQVDVEKVALLPLQNDQQQLSEIIHNELASAPGQLQFYTRSLKDWSRIANERDLSSSMNTKLDESTIANLRSVHGVKAILTGSIRQASSKNGSAIVTLSLRLINIETNRQLWSGNIEGSYTKPGPSPKVSPLNRKATLKAAQSLARSLKSEFRINTPTKAYSTPVQGDFSHLWKYIGPELKKSKINNLKFYDFSSSKSKGYQAHLNRELSTRNFGLADLSRLNRQLDQLDGLLAGDDDNISNSNNSTSSSHEKPKRTLLTVDIYESQEEEDEDTTERKNFTVSLNATITDLDTGETIWTTSITETAKEDKRKVNERFWNNLVKNVTSFLSKEVDSDAEPTIGEMIFGTVILLFLGFIGLIVLFFIFRTFTRSR